MTLTEVQQKLRDRLDRISAYAHEHGALWENGDGTDDIIIAYAEHQATVIKRLQEANTNFACQACDRAQEIERLQGEMENYGDDYVCQMKSKDVRIQELEDALVKERAKTLAAWCQGDCGEVVCDMIRHASQARQQLRAEGKIGPEDAKPRSWQITEERILAIENAISSCVLIERYTGQDLQHETAVLRTMLGDAK